MTITALHGFLGLPRDWDFLREAGLDVNALDVFRDDVPRRGDTLLGYSLGGRLALQSLLAGAAYERAIIVSARVSPAEEERRERDEAWARRFESDDWPNVMRDWNAQPLFGGHELPRDEREFDRATLAGVLREWSPAVLPPVVDRLHQLTLPVLWVAGERDQRYVDEGRRAVEALPNAELAIVRGAAHRVPWEQPRAFVELVRAFAR